MQWLRLYDDVLDDPKVQQLKPELFRYWINLLCLANKNEPRGLLPDINAIAFRLRVPELKVRAILFDLHRFGLIDRDFGEEETLRPHNWDDRQKRSDNVAARVAKHRGNVSSNDDVTLQPRYTKQVGNVLDTDTDTDTDTEQIQSREEQNRETPKPPSGDSFPAEFLEFWSAYPTGHGSKPKSLQVWKIVRADHAAIMAGLVEWQRSDRWQRGMVMAAERWLKERQWENPPPGATNGHVAHPNWAWPRLPMPPGFVLPPEMDNDKLAEMLQWREIGMTIPSPYLPTVERYVAAIRGGSSS